MLPALQCSLEYRMQLERLRRCLNNSAAKAKAENDRCKCVCRNAQKGCFTVNVDF